MGGGGRLGRRSRERGSAHVVIVRVRAVLRARGQPARGEVGAVGLEQAAVVVGLVIVRRAEGERRVGCAAPLARGRRPRMAVVRVRAQRRAVASVAVAGREHRRPRRHRQRRHHHRRRQRGVAVAQIRRRARRRRWLLVVIVMRLLVGIIVMRLPVVIVVRLVRRRRLLDQMVEDARDEPRERPATRREPASGATPLQSVAIRGSQSQSVAVSRNLPKVRPGPQRVAGLPRRGGRRQWLLVGCGRPLARAE